MSLLIWIAIFVVSALGLIKSADIFTKYSEKLGVMLGLSSFIIGATIVAVGTSLPELVSSVYAVAFTGSTEFVVDNIIGSNVANALLILGIGAIVGKTLKVKTSLVDVDLPFFFTSMAIFVYFILDKVITVFEAVFLFAFFIIFVIYSVKAEDSEEDKEEKAEMKKLVSKEEKERKSKLIPRYVGIILVGMVGIAASAKFFIDSILNIADQVGISSSVLTITVVAIGTSLPEILASVSAIKAGNHSIAIGNVFGSNTFNIALVGSIPAIFGNLNVDPATFAVGVPFLIIATMIAIFSTFDNTVRSWEGVSLLFVYSIFLAAIVGVI